MIIEKRFHGPDGSGNGGYVAGLLAARVASDTVTVTLRRPPPLDTELTVTVEDERALGVRLWDGEHLVAEALAGAIVVPPVPPVPFETALEAARRYRAIGEHPFPRCFVCGPEREPGDGLLLEPGPVVEDAASVGTGLAGTAGAAVALGTVPAGPAPTGPASAEAVLTDTVLTGTASTGAVPAGKASTGTVSAGTAAGGTAAVGTVAAGTVAAPWVPAEAPAPELVWAALDCPGGWSFDVVGRPAVLGTMTAQVVGAPEAGERCVVMGLARSREGRKMHAATALYGADGRLLGRAEQIWIEIDPAGFGG